MSEILNTHHNVTIGSDGILLPNSLYQSGKPLQTQHLSSEPELTKSFLLGYADRNNLDGIFDQEGRIALKTNINPYELHGRDIVKKLSRLLVPWYELVQQSYLKGHDGDFNNHLIFHVQRVGDMAVHILKNCDPNMTQQDTDNTLISGVLHDLGGIQSRREHANLAPHIAKDIIPALTTDPHRFLEISNAIVQHDEGYFRKLKGYSNEPFDRRSRTLQVTQTPMSAALIIADKSDVGRERVHKGSRKKNSMHKHIHSEVNMFTGDLGIDISDDSLTWTVAFNPYIHNREYKSNEDLVIANVNDEYYLAYGSPRIRVDPSDPYKGISFKKVWNELCHIYGPQQVGQSNRLQIMVDTALTWFRPNFIINYYNPYTEEMMIHELNANNVDAFFEEMAFNNVKLNEQEKAAGSEKAIGVI
jgi:hypothetical protein